MSTIAPEHHPPWWQPVTSFVPTQNLNILVLLILLFQVAPIHLKVQERKAAFSRQSYVYMQ